MSNEPEQDGLEAAEEEIDEEPEPEAGGDPDDAKVENFG